MSNSKEVNQKEATSTASALHLIFTATEEAAATLDDKRANYLIGSVILGAANRAAWSAQNAEERVSQITDKAREYIEKMGFEGNEREVSKFYDDQQFWAEQAPAYHDVYNACESAYFELTGKPMPSQRPGAKLDSKRVTTPADQMLAAFGMTPDTKGEKAKIAAANKPKRARATAAK